MRVSRQHYSHLFVRYVKPNWPMVLALAVLLTGSIGLQLVNPQIMRGFIDTAQSGGPASYLTRAALLFIGIAVVQQVVSLLVTYVGESVGWSTTNELRADLAEHCLQLDMSFHNVRAPGEMIERIDGDVSALANFFTQFVIGILGSAVYLVGVLVLLFREDWRVGAALTGFALITIMVLSRLRNIAVPHWTARREAFAELFGFLEERLSGTEDIRSCGAKAYVMRRFYQLIRDVMNKVIKSALMTNIVVNTSMLLIALGTAVALGVGAYVFRAGMVTIGTVYLIFHYTVMLEMPIRRITHEIEYLQQAAAAIARIQELFQTRSRIRDGERTESDVRPFEGAALPGGPLAVEFRAVSFAYHDALAKGDRECSPDDRAPEDGGEETVLHDLSFRLPSGAVLGLLGRTGSGKTTLTRLLYRLYDPSAGEVYLGDGAGSTDIRSVPLTELRQRVGMVTQNVQLFRATVRDNLTFFDPDIPDEVILQVIRELGLETWFGSLPEGLDTEMESGGGGLSAGEAQLLAFTRIFLRDPGLVILDEASSRLDPATERLLERAVDRLLRDRTAIIIAHRLETVHRADRIIILEAGRMIEHGMRSELARDPASHFRRLLQSGLEEVLA